MGKLKIFFAGLFAAIAVTGCGGGSGGGLTGAGNPGGQTTGNYTIAVSIPTTNAIVQKSDEQAGFYSLSGSVIVTDRNGNAPPKGTVVYLDVIDTIKAKGFVDSISGSTLTDAAPTLADGSATDFTIAGVRRGGAFRGIGGNDLILLTNNADNIDQNRSVSTDTGAILANSIKASVAYSTTYPNSTYTANTTSYVIGAAEVGGTIIGIDYKSGNRLSGYTTTDENGIGKFRFEYPANDNTIRLGCFDPTLDTRFNITGSADVYAVARLSDNSVTTISTDLCYSSILPWTFTVSDTAISGTKTITGTLKDAQSLGIPFITITPSVKVDTDTGTALSVTPTPCVTALHGTCSSTITVAASGADSGDKATITYSSTNPKFSTSVTLTIP